MTPTPVVTVEGPRVEHSPPKPGHKKEHPPHKATIKSTVQPTQQKKVPRRSSKPIINWFQRKLAGTVKAKRPEVLSQTVELGRNKSRSLTTPRGGARVASSPLPSPGLTGRQQARLDALSASRRKTISLNGEDGARDCTHRTGPQDDDCSDQSSLARVSTWSPGSVLEADEDASVRPIPPSTPPSPSPSPSRSSSSYLSDPRTFRSMAASTKPTTVLSIDLNAGGMAHIAQAPLTPASQISRFPPHIRTSSSLTNPGGHGSGGSITFSALPQSSSRPSSLLNPGSLNPSQTNHLGVSSVQAPLHTAHHPRNNPRPSSPPLDNASMLTLASSAYAVPGLRVAVGMMPNGSAPPSALGAGDSMSHFGGSTTYPDAESASQYVPGDDERLEERDFDASVRALRPRSSRRGSWESEASGWSARIQVGTGTPSLAREMSLWTTNSIRTGRFSAENVEVYERSEEEGNTNRDISQEPSPSDGDPVNVEAVLGSAAITQSSLQSGTTRADSETAMPPTPDRLGPAEKFLGPPITESPQTGGVKDLTLPQKKAHGALDTSTEASGAPDA